ncbi:MAG TPA: 2-phosphosulfolactate phosphatase [Verrucomicrobiae bacterium]|nr:2-phosphosulfolactate phosphatase [Verrucomicrobiae bacterium]
MSNPAIDVLFTPADFEALARVDLSDATCVIFDVLRATSTMVTALARGAAGILPCAGIPEALRAKQDNPAMLLAGERDGLRITAALSGSIDFDLGNSPREFTAEKIRDHAIAMTTTNGTRALVACARASTVLIGSFLNLSAALDALRNALPKRVLLVCSGTHEEAALEDVLAAGAFCESMLNFYPDANTADSARMAFALYQAAKGNLPQALAMSRNGQRLQRIPDLSDDIAFCAQLNAFPIATALKTSGLIQKL